MPHPAADLLNRAERARKEGRFADARDDVAAAVEICRKSSPPYWPLAIALRTLGEAARRVEDRQGARQAYEEAVVLMRRDAEPLTLAHTVRHLGDVYQEQDSPELARPCYEEALALYRTHDEGGSLDSANALRAFAAHLDDAGDDERAAPLWEEARGLYGSSHIHAGVVECSLRLARIARREGDAELVGRRLAEAEAAAKESGDAELLTRVAQEAARLAEPAE